jgi:hypothetical protein
MFIPEERDTSHMLQRYHRVLFESAIASDISNLKIFTISFDHLAIAYHLPYIHNTNTEQETTNKS